MSRLWILVLLLLTLSPSDGSAQPRRSGGLRPEQIERWRRMSPQERRRMLERLPPDRRERIERRLEEFERLPPARQEQLRRQYDAFRQLPPDKQQAVRQMYRRFNELPQNRKALIRRQLNFLRSMTPEQRHNRLNSPGLRNRLSPEEHNILSEMVENLAVAEQHP